MAALLFRRRLSFVVLDGWETPTTAGWPDPPETPETADWTVDSSSAWMGFLLLATLLLPTLEFPRLDSSEEWAGGGARWKTAAARWPPTWRWSTPEASPVSGSTSVTPGMWILPRSMASRRLMMIFLLSYS